MAPIVARHAVHIGWGVDTFDYNCSPGDGSCVYNNFVNAVKTPGTGAYGSVLMHSVHAQTANALGGIIDYARGRGFQFWSTEQLVRARYGKSSGEIIGGGGTTTPPPATGGVQPQVGGTYEVALAHSNSCLDLAEGSAADGAKIQQWACNNGPNQRWRVEAGPNGTLQLVQATTGKCMDVSGPSTANGAAIHQWTCFGETNQVFRLQPGANNSYSLRFEHSGSCADLGASSVANGAALQQWACHGGANQRFIFRQR